MSGNTGAPKGNQNAIKHGMSGLKRRLMVRGMAGIDKRYQAPRLVLRWKAALLVDLGGADLSTQKKALVDGAVQTMLLLGAADSFLMEQESIVNKRKRCLLPVVRERIALQDSLLRILQALGLERVAKPVPSLEEYIREKYGKPSDGDGNGAHLTPDDAPVAHPDREPIRTPGDSEPEAPPA